MASFFRSHGPTILAVGTGLALGSVATYILQTYTARISRQLAELSIKLDILRREVDELRRLLDNKNGSKKSFANKAVFELQSELEQISSGDDEEEEFQEAFSGSEFEPLNNGERFYSPASSSSVLSSLEDAPSLRQLAAQADALLDGDDDDKQKALHLLSKYETRYGSDPEFLWRFSKASYNMAQCEGGKGNLELKKTLFYKSQQLASRALSINSNNAAVHKWYAVTVGSLGEYEGVQAKIQNGYKFKEHIEKSIEIQPQDPSSHYLLGRWCYGVSMLTWVERQLASTLYATPPSSTVDEALKHFVSAENLNPGQWKENELYIAKCLIEKRDYYNAVEWLDKAASIPTRNHDDRKAQKEVEDLLYKYSGYRR